MSFSVLAMAASLLLHAQLLPQDPPVQAAQPVADGAQDPETEVESIDVIGRRDSRERTEAFVANISAPLRFQGLARWDRGICVGVANMPAAEAQRMIDRVSAVALALELRVGEPGCRPDVLVIATPDPDRLARDLVRENGDTFRPSFNGTDRGRTALREFERSDAPVRWWQVSLPISVDSGAIATQLRADDAPPTISSPTSSRLRSSIRFDMAKVIVIIDTRRLGDVTFSALTDYVAMVALAQIDPAAEVANYPTILNLFGPAPAPGLTEWDAAYLQSLYSAQRDRAVASGQVNEIVNDMTARLAGDPDATPQP